MARRHDDSVLCVGLNPSDRDVVEHMKSALGIGSDANLVRTALWSLADHADIDMPPDAFELRIHVPPVVRKGTKTKRPNPKISQHRHHVRPGAGHPWRKMNQVIRKGQE